MKSVDKLIYNNNYFFINTFKIIYIIARLKEKAN